MKYTKLISVLILVVLTLNSCKKDDDTDASRSDGATTYSEIEKEILRLTNEHRKTLEKPDLVMNEILWKGAGEHTQYMINKGKIGHDNFSERLVKLIEELGSGGGRAENVAKGQRTAKAVVDAWLDSQGHRENIEGDFTIIGIAAIKDANGNYYYTQIFVRQ